MKDRYCFPAVFNYAPDGVSVYFPDLPGCVTGGDTTEEALHNAREALEGFLWGNEQDNDPIPDPSNPLVLKAETEENQIVVPVEAYMPPVRDEFKNKAVNKMVTLPRWMIDEGKKAGINFSHLLQDALREKLSR